MRARLAMLVAVIALMGCGSVQASGVNQAAVAHLMTVDALAAGNVDALPSGNQFVRVQHFEQLPGAAGLIGSKRHQVGIIYQELGTQVLQYADGTSRHITAGTGVFLESVQHAHLNDGSDPNSWYNISLWSSLQRGTPLTKVVFETEDIPAGEFPTQSYVETLRRVTLQSGGRSYSHSFSGVEVLYVLDGSLTVKLRGHAALQVPAGQGTFVAPNTVTQELADGGAATYLAFFVNPVGRAIETIVTSPP